MTYDVVSTRKVRKIILFKRPEDIFDFVKRYANSKQEQFLVVTLNGAHQVISVKLATIGLANRTIVHPREVFVHAIKDGASAVVVAHNHPSGNVKPSPEDDNITDKLKRAADVLGINLLDHLVFSKTEYYSFRQNGRLWD